MFLGQHIVNCKHCGTEIAAKALICYRCGRSTADEVPRASTPSRRAGRRADWIKILAALILAVSALYMGQTTFGQVPRELSWTLAGLAAIVLAWRIRRRGRT